MNAPTSSLLHGLGGRKARVLTSSVEIGDEQIRQRALRLASRLVQQGIDRVASQLDNGIHWLVLDLAVRELGGVHVPLPTFFSSEQITHALESSGAQCVVTASGAPAPTSSRGALGTLDGGMLAQWRTDPATSVDLPTGTACVTYTSGTTGRPKGVCLSADTLLTVARSLVQGSSAIAPRRHLCLMPLSTLLENVAGLYATLLADAQIALPSLAEIGYTGASGLDVPTLLRCLHRYQPESIILVPQLLLAVVMAAESGAPLPTSLRYIAVGGGRVGPALLARARALRLPVFEGYGLTECASVVCLNQPGSSRDGSVGKALPHARIAIVDNEIQVEGARALGYLGAEPLPEGPIRTGDLGRVDGDGFIFVTGRRKNVFITAFGRNVSPEWVESELLSHPDLAQAVVWGEAQADNVAVLVPRRADLDDAALARAVAEVNAGLPDYARVSRIVRAPAPFSAGTGLLTANGRLRRDAILSHFQAEVDASYRRPASVPSTGVSA